MKLYLTLILCLWARYLDAQGWSKVNLPIFTNQIASINDGILFGDTAILIGSNGLIIQSVDFLQTVKIDSEWAGRELRSMSFPVSDTGFINSPYVHGGLLLTYNSGNDWSENFNNPYSSADWGARILFPTSGIGYAYYTSTNVYFKTTDGGHQWTQYSVASNNCKRILSLTSENDSILFLLASNDPAPYPTGHLYLFKSNDGGINWGQINSFYESGFSYCYSLKDSVLLVVTNNSIYRSENSGTSFNLVLLTENSEDVLGPNMNCFSFPSRDTGFIAFLGSVYRTVDKGNSWLKTNYHYNWTENNSIRFVSASNGNLAIVGCLNGEVYKTDVAGGTWNDIVTLSKNPLLWHLQPTLAISFLTIQTENSISHFTINIYSDNGSKIKTLKISPGTTNIDIDDLSPGLYVLELQSNSYSSSKIFIKQ